MQTLKLKGCQSLNSAFLSTEPLETNGMIVTKTVLKTGKALSVDPYLKVLAIKNRLSKVFEELSEKEREIIDHYDATIVDGKWHVDVKDGNEQEAEKSVKEIDQKLKDLHKTISVEIPDAFVDQKEFIEWTKDASTESASVLAQYFLKGFNDVPQ